MDCNIINQNEYGVFMLRSIMQMRRNQFQSICGEDCTVSADLGQDFTCYSGILSLHWPTNITYPSNTQTISDGLSRKLRRKINRTEIMKTLEIYVISHQPPIIQAKVDHLEQAVTLVLQ
ncbi:hypothetical protein EB796_018216 [Bugula neritina]|uniref:Uncharacterized protein n=1 Tax=Bugula neritina TaxID=10212 RepID=A0A7J7JCV8_BUGNE|nr:hypothetical protein EB796_018216 [Bugula neritina]